MSNRGDYHLPPTADFVVTHFFTVADVNRSAEFYVRIFGGTLVRSGESTIIQLVNSWLMVNVGGGPTDDKPTATLHRLGPTIQVDKAFSRPHGWRWRSRQNPGRRT
jgi:catechol 2,3-dioxygenase-like lactoylglutathione lyase family enzyme